MSAPNLKEIEWKISELEQQESSWSGYEKLSVLYTVRNEMLSLSASQPKAAAHSDVGGTMPETLDQYGDSDFLAAVSGKDQAAAWKVMDELMDTLQVVNRRAYDSVMRKLDRL